MVTHWLFYAYNDSNLPDQLLLLSSMGATLGSLLNFWGRNIHMAAYGKKRRMS